MLAVQFVVLGKEAKEAVGAVSHLKLLVALMAGVTASAWVSFQNFGSFASLLLSGVLFFGSYLGVLLILKETLVKDLILQLLKKK